MRARAGTRHSVVRRSRTDVHGPYFTAAASLRGVRTRDGLDSAVSGRSVDVMPSVLLYWVLHCIPHKT